MYVIFQNFYNAKFQKKEIDFSGQASMAYVWVMPTMRSCWPNTNYALPKLDSLENWLKTVFSHVLIVVRIQCNKSSQGRKSCVFTNHHLLPIHSLNNIFYGPGIGQGAEVSVVSKSSMITILMELSQCNAEQWGQLGGGAQRSKGVAERINKVNIKNCVEWTNKWFCIFVKKKLDENIIGKRSSGKSPLWKVPPWIP